MGSTTNGASWQTAKSADGPSVARFLDDWLARHGQTAGVYGDAFTRRLYAWRSGENVGFFTLDRHLTTLGLMPQDLPDHVWRACAAKAREPVAA